MEFIKKSFKEKQHLLIKLLLQMLFQFYMKNVQAIPLSEFTTWMKLGFFIGKNSSFIQFCIKNSDNSKFLSDWNQTKHWLHNDLLDERKTESACLLLCAQMQMDHINWHL
jgi:hypothetical protein